MRTRPVYDFGEFSLDPAVRELRHQGERVSLPPKSFDCLVYLIEQRERAVGRDELISAVWGRAEVSDAVLAQTLLRARRAVGDTGSEQTTIRTVPRFGYRWVAPLTTTISASTEEAIVSPQSFDGPEDREEPPEESVAAVPGDAASATTAAKRPLWRRSLPIVAAATVALAALLWWGLAQRSHGPVSPVQASTQSKLAVVLPMTVAADNAEQAWVRLGAMDYIASRMRGNGGLNVLPSSQVLQLAEERPGDADAQARRLLATTGARWIIQPRAVANRNDWSVRLHMLQADQQASIDVEARGDTVLTASAAATDSLLRRLGHLRSGAVPAPTALAERLQQIDAELLAGQLANARALIHGVASDLRGEPQLRLREGQLEFRAGNLDAAKRAFDHLLAQGREVPDEVRAQAAMGRGSVAVRSGDFRTAEQRYGDAVAALEHQDRLDPTLIGNAYNGRGIARLELGSEADAIADIGRARLAMQRAGNDLEVASVDTNLGMLESRRGNDTRAIQQFDRAIATFARFGVTDNLVAALQAKATAQMRMAQPAAALASIARASAVIDRIENPLLRDRIGVVQAEVSMANGRLREAEAWLARLQAKPRTSPLPALDKLRLRLLLVRGNDRAAADLAKTLAGGADAGGESILLGVQAALRIGDAGSARNWLQRADAQARADTSWALANALLAANGASSIDAEAAFKVAEASLSRAGTPDARIDVGCAHAADLIRRGVTDRASAILGEIGTLADNDYRIAHTTLALYRALDDASAIRTSDAAMKSVAGERNPALPLTY